MGLRGMKIYYTKIKLWENWNGKGETERFKISIGNYAHIFNDYDYWIKLLWYLDSFGYTWKGNRLFKKC